MKTTPVCTIRSVQEYERRIEPRYAAARYWVRCRLCPATTPTDRTFAGIFGGNRTTLGWATNLEHAIRYADAHATLHLDHTCPTCNHTPTVDVTGDDTNALMIARSAQ